MLSQEKRDIYLNMPYIKELFRDFHKSDDITDKVDELLPRYFNKLYSYLNSDNYSDNVPDDMMIIYNKCVFFSNFVFQSTYDFDCEDDVDIFMNLQQRAVQLIAIENNHVSCISYWKQHDLNVNDFVEIVGLFRGGYLDKKQKEQLTKRFHQTTQGMLF